MELPTKPKVPIKVNPKFFILFSKPKAGKTTALSLLENNLLIDIEDGSDFVGGMTVKANNMDDIRSIKDALIKSKDEGKQYKYITLDTATALEDMVGELAIKLYKDTPMGANYGKKKGEDDVRKLPNGAGYLFLREAYEKVVDIFKQFPTECLILTGHVVDKMVNKNGEEVSEMQLDLTGKLGRIMYSRADAVGFLYREGNKCIINFDGGGDVIIEARPAHLRGKKIVISEMQEDGTITTNWDKIFI